jgi:hypothetical protein
VQAVADSVRAERTSEPGRCPECGASALQRYKVLATGGWFEVVKCQSCLASLERRPWNRLGYVDRDHGLALGHENAP